MSTFLRVLIHLMENAPYLKRLSKWCLIIALSTLPTAMVVTQPNQTANLPNIILIMCDDLGWGDVGFNGNQVVQTPNLDQLAQEGVILRRFYSAGAVCSPTRASCLTGRHPDRMGIFSANHGHMKSEEITLPELLQEEGYHTGHFGKWHLGTLTTKIRDANRGRPRDGTHYSIPTQHGYQQYLVTESKVPTHDPLIKPDTFDAQRGESLRYGWSALESDEDARLALSYGTHYWKGEESIELHNVQGSNARILMDRVIPFVSAASASGAPFFASIWFHTPHLPLVTDREQRKRYQHLTHQEQLFYGAISAMDEQVGRLWTVLENLNEADNTLLWFCSDNGPEVKTPGSSGPFRGRKRDLYEGGIRVPAFCLWPAKLAGGSEVHAPLVTSDYLPTILKIINKKYPSNRPLDGMDIWSLITKETTKRNRAIGFSFRLKQSWVTDDHKLISLDKGRSFALYHITEDSAETLDLSNQFPQLQKALEHELSAWLTSLEQSNLGKDYDK